ncbi:MAG: response regulator [Chloroflexi bacterium]|nr:response regulator [Chloroflexota bacterium]
MIKKDTHILIVDDDIDLCKSLEIILRREGYPVETVVSGLQAIDLVQQKTFELILIDVVIPDLNGVETLKIIHELSPQSRIVMMTGFAVADLVSEAIQLGVDGVLYKPFNVDVVLNNLLSEDIINVFEGYLQAAWERIMPVIGVLSAQMIFQRAFSQAFGEKSLTIYVGFCDQGISLENIREHRLDMDEQELRMRLRTFLAQIFDLLENLTGNMFTSPLVEKISDNLKTKKL